MEEIKDIKKIEPKETSESTELSKTSNGKWSIISLGGSLIVPEKGIDIEFLKGFTEMIRDLVVRGRRFLIVTGGGNTARSYEKTVKELSQRESSESEMLKMSDLDWLGIHATRLNAHLLRTLLHDLAVPRIITNPEQDELNDGKVIIGAGWRPGFSTDYDAVILARRLGAKRIINITDVEYVYEDDPKKNPRAKPYKDMTWKSFLALVGDQWHPGLNAPFDPVAARLCDEAGIEVAILSGKDLANARRALLGEEFKGTLIRSPL